MHQPRRFSFAVLSLLFLFSPTSHADESVRVNESRSKVVLRNGVMAVSLGVENLTGRKLGARVEIELLDPDGRSCGRAERDEQIAPGSSKVPFDLPMPTLKPADLDTVFWYRLRYAISPSSSGGEGLSPVSGVISVSEIAPDMFELQVAYPAGAKLGAPLHVLVRAIQPVTSRPVAGVRIQAELDASDTDSIKPLAVSATTDSRGYAPLDFVIPATADADRPSLKITGQRGGYTVTVDNDETFLFHFSKFLLSTDKPLYQPGQTLHARVLAFGPNQRAVANQPIEIRILDPENTLVFRANLKTSRYGIASADWTIPSNQRLGLYRVKTDYDEDDSEEGAGSATVKISRYELPNFTVTAKPDKSFYLPGQNAEVAVHADYLFGQPVARGHVRVVRENEREWNYHDQKWDIEEGDVYEGDTDASGSFVARIDLSQEHRDLTGEDYSRFRDYRFTAYFTDSTSTRTEERRFDLRVTKDSIHVYVLPSGQVMMKHGLDFYVSTDRADGAPVSCDVTIRAAEDEPAAGAPLSGRVLRTVHTNRYGLAKVTNLTISGEDEDEDDYPSLVLQAAGAPGESGTHVEDFQPYNAATLRVATDKTFYRPGDPIEVRIASDDSDATVELEAASDWRFIASQIVRLHHGRASFTFEPNDKFVGPVEIAAYELGRRPGHRYRETQAHGSHTVLFPHDTSLQLDVRMSKATYRPGEEAQASFHVGSSDGDTQKSALGLVVIDKAVEERQRTDQDLRRNWGFYSFLPDWNGGGELAGIDRSDLDKIDPSKPLSQDYGLVAEALLQDKGDGPQFDSSSYGESSLHELFKRVIDPPLSPVIEAMRAQSNLPKSPGGEAGIRQLLSTTAFPHLLDPWDTPYRAKVEPLGANYQITLVSAGPDKKFDTDDDFTAASFAWPYFNEYAAVIRNAAEKYHTRTGEYIRDAATLQSELLAKGVAFDSLRDPWGHAYRLEFGIRQNLFTIDAVSAGPDGVFGTKDAPSFDDVVVAQTGVDYFAATQHKIETLVNNYYQDAGHFPATEKDLVDALHAGGVDWESLRDPWGHRYYAAFRQEAQYSNAVRVQSYADYQAGQHTTIRPVTADIEYIDIRSSGADGKTGTPDDFEAAIFLRAVYPEGANGPAGAPAATTFSGEMGAIAGRVIDPSGAAIANAKVTATRNNTGEVFEAASDGDGKFIVRNVRPGTYDVRFRMLGFQDSVFTGVPVASSSVTQLNATLQVGTVTQTVTVEAQAESMQTESATVNATQIITLSPKSDLGAVVQAPVSTPRLREYFPETLLWQPEVITDSHGTAHLKFALADSITTWKLAVVASTVDGRIGTAEKEVRAFQPFFADQDLPQFLTAGDEIGLPVILRNYLDHSEQVDLKLDAQPWLTLLGPATQHTEVAASDSARAIFPMRAETPIKDGKQRVTAIGKGAADAIEKKTTVRPFGEEKAASVSQIFEDSAVLKMSIPQTALPGSIESELKVYPNLMAHVWEAIEAILERPYGCGEQTISSTYPSVLLLQYAKRAGREDSSEVMKARKYAQLGYDRLLSYQDDGGGFTYWGREDTADVALTAYAVMFLHDAKDVISVDDSVVERAREWLLKQAQPDGHWPAHLYWSKDEDARRSAMLTAYVARVLAATSAQTGNQPADTQAATVADRELGKALGWLGPRTEQVDEPYLIASYALALIESGTEQNRVAAARPLARLQALAHTEGDTAYWALETNTPFYGWGRAGRLETTALVVEALERGARVGQPADRNLVERGTLFLLRNQDRYGIWYTTQATINVLRAMAASVSAASPPAKTAASEAGVFVDGKPAATIALPPDNELSAPVIVDLSKFAGPGDHRVEIRRAAGASEASAQLAESYYVPWTSDAAAESLHQKNDSAEALRLAITYDRTRAKIGEKITCAVKAERVDRRGYGMMLAEIGLPPGAEVNRDSLDKAMTDSGWDINQVDVLPDRVIVYLWPRAGGTTFTFNFTTRFGINAETTRSVLYDYYNPDAQAVVAPTRLAVQ
ncbi:MAG TPA: MG2 domain-containing protein [Verrucomicrobiae bacterium]|nr:MG2 domain-containing protein [Verrucomicrobiae bacterium]